MDVRFRKARKEDINEIIELYKKCVIAMGDAGNDQWDEEYPNEEVASQDIKEETLLVALYAGQIVGVVTMNHEMAPEYSGAKWKVDTKLYQVIHRLAIEPKYHGQGIGRSLMFYAEEQARLLGMKTIRLDTYSRNRSAVIFYEDIGYKARGSIHMPRRKPHYICFDKVLS